MEVFVCVAEIALKQTKRFQKLRRRRTKKTTCFIGSLDDRLPRDRGDGAASIMTRRVAEHVARSRARRQRRIAAAAAAAARAQRVGECAVERDAGDATQQRRQ